MQEPVKVGAGAGPDLKLNQIQVLGTHNSYSQGVDPRLLAMLDEAFSKKMEQAVNSMSPAAHALFEEEHPNTMPISEMLSYSHPGLVRQLDLGVRSLELDVNPDPEGGAFRDPAGYRILRQKGVKDLLPFDPAGLDKPGFKVLHMPDIDFRSSCNTLRLCLGQIRDWSDAHPGHVPIFILIEAKVQAIPLLPGASKPVPFSPALFDALDAELVDTMGRDRIITPDDVRGKYPTLNKAVLAGGWPRLADARGKVLFLMLTANGPDGASDYLVGHPGLKGRVAFLRAMPGEDHAAFLLLDNALVRGSEIRKYVEQGYLVRTRSDIETYEAKTNDMTRARAAFASGAQIVSTDFEQAGNAYGTSYVVRLPGGGDMRCDPVNARGF